jgi:hypothetical protein
MRARGVHSPLAPDVPPRCTRSPFLCLAPRRQDAKSRLPIPLRLCGFAREYLPTSRDSSHTASVARRPDAAPSLPPRPIATAATKPVEFRVAALDPARRRVERPQTSAPRHADAHGVNRAGLVAARYDPHRGGVCPRTVVSEFQPPTAFTADPHSSASPPSGSLDRTRLANVAAVLDPGAAEPHHRLRP